MVTRIRDIRLKLGTTFNTTFTAANAAGWNMGADSGDTVYRVNATSWDASALVHEGIENTQVQTSLFDSSANVPGLRTGEAKLGMYLGKGSSDTTAPFMATLLSKFFGNIANPTAKTDLCEADCTTTVLNVTGHGMSAGQAVLVGTRGDARGEGEVRLIKSTTTDTITLSMALSGAPSASDALVFSHTVYLDADATQAYIDFLAIGSETEDQVQGIGCMGSVTFTGLSLGEIPGAEFSLMAADNQQVPAGERDSIDTSDGYGEEAPASKGLSGFFLQDQASSTRTAFQCANFSVDPSLTYEAIPDMNGVNGIGGWKKVGKSPMTTMDLLIDQDVGLFDDFSSSTAKQLVVQYGATADNCIAFSFPYLYLTKSPTRGAINSLDSISVEMRAKKYSSGSDNLGKSPMAIHWF